MLWGFAADWHVLDVAQFETFADGLWYIASLVEYLALGPTVNRKSQLTTPIFVHRNDSELFLLSFRLLKEFLHHDSSGVPVLWRQIFLLQDWRSGRGRGWLQYLIEGGQHQSRGDWQSCTDDGIGAGGMQWFSKLLWWLLSEKWLECGPWRLLKAEWCKRLSVMQARWYLLLLRLLLLLISKHFGSYSALFSDLLFYLCFILILFWFN